MFAPVSLSIGYDYRGSFLSHAYVVLSCGKTWVILNFMLKNPVRGTDVLQNKMSCENGDDARPCLCGLVVYHR